MSRKCFECQGTGKHRKCRGKGCKECANTGMCMVCYGSGELKDEDKE